MSLTAQVKKAFARSAPHPADKSVRLVDRRVDLAVINHPSVRAAVWQRDMPQDFAAELARLQRQWQVEQIHAADMAPLMQGTGAYAREQGFLRALFRKVTGKAPETGGFNARGTSCGDADREKFMPHYDVGFDKRIVVSYAHDAQMGTEWYPGNPDMRAFQREVLTLPAADIPAAKARRNVQSFRPGNVIILKGSMHENPFPHSAPQIKPGVLRMVSLVGS